MESIIGDKSEDEVIYLYSNQNESSAMIQFWKLERFFTTQSGIHPSSLALAFARLVDEGVLINAQEIKVEFYQKDARDTSNNHESVNRMRLGNDYDTASTHQTFVYTPAVRRAVTQMLVPSLLSNNETNLFHMNIFRAKVSCVLSSIDSTANRLNKSVLRSFVDSYGIGGLIDFMTRLCHCAIISKDRTVIKLTMASDSVRAGQAQLAISESDIAMAKLNYAIDTLHRSIDATVGRMQIHKQNAIMYRERDTKIALMHMRLFKLYSDEHNKQANALLQLTAINENIQSLETSIIVRDAYVIATNCLRARRIEANISPDNVDDVVAEFLEEVSIQSDISDTIAHEFTERIPDMELNELEHDLAYLELDSEQLSPTKMGLTELDSRSLTELPETQFENPEIPSNSSWKSSKLVMW